MWPRPITPTRESRRAVTDPEGLVVSEAIMTFLAEGQWRSSSPLSCAGSSIEFTLMVWTSPARHLAQ
jgi:hypothetical protein